MFELKYKWLSDSRKHKAESRRLEAAIQEALDTMGNTELNMGNYTDDDVYNLNNAMICCWEILTESLKKEGKPI